MSIVGRHWKSDADRTIEPQRTQSTRRKMDSAKCKSFNVTFHFAFFTWNCTFAFFYLFFVLFVYFVVN